MDSTTLANEIKNKILSELDPLATIEIIDETHKHAKHRGFIEGKYHYLVNVSSKKLSDMAKIKAHKEIFRCTQSLMPQIHALSIKIKPE
ncbi:bolA-like family protein [Francisella philomiragia subsp. philomiragia ATCC 25015]|uniref:BolA family protein n=1 Tax=Francisella philomiragia TaxID=28110 RepID=UPI0001AF78B5|nr:BolA/IbaG family iron-sulfur metabolism protein [Francisella philomiragia]AJI74189.1 bolA-like family protein [Francisella philomiragia subsp. philomiragia ATCC 25015]EET21208.1 conserved hypothetical protein [Francisella philomiragia subsp. philomiragia ATCC 25015]MBK2238861.1 BolA/IbaG family iron-sulfur metabolism protein [Francisella philomiragia]